MAFHVINIGVAANDGTGDDLRTAGDKLNKNFSMIENSTIGTYVVKNSNFEAESLITYLVDTTVGPVTVTLPLSPLLGERMKFVDINGAFSVFNLNVDRNSKNIDGVATNKILSTNFAKLELEYVGGLVGWLTI